MKFLLLLFTTFYHLWLFEILTKDSFKLYFNIWLKTCFSSHNVMTLKIRLQKELFEINFIIIDNYLNNKVDLQVNSCVFCMLRQ